MLNHMSDCPVMIFDIFFMRVSPYLVPWLRELHVIVHCGMHAAHWYIHIS